MKKAALICFLIFYIIFIVSCSNPKVKNQLLDGTYESESRAQYINEPYWGQCRIIITNGEIAEFEFRIIDKSCNQIFDENYEKHFAGNAIYINQCRNDLKGLKEYINRFVETRDLNKIDAVSGATWSYNIFRDAVTKTLEKASKK